MWVSFSCQRAEWRVTLAITMEDTWHYEQKWNNISKAKALSIKTLLKLLVKLKEQWKTEYFDIWVKLLEISSLKTSRGNVKFSKQRWRYIWVCVHVPACVWCMHECVVYAWVCGKWVWEWSAWYVWCVWVSKCTCVCGCATVSRCCVCSRVWAHLWGL